MTELILGLLGFGFFFLSDGNDWKFSRTELRFCFPVGAVLVVCGTAAGLYGAKSALGAPLRLLLGLAALAFLALLVDALFFALPAKASYTQPGQARKACTGGMYALCRHPGVLWFCGFYFCLSGAGGFPLRASLLYSACNVLLVIFEDILVFPAKLEGYAAYKRTTPFLLPTPKSIRACFRR